MTGKMRWSVAFKAFWSVPLVLVLIVGICPLGWDAFAQQKQKTQEEEDMPEIQSVPEDTSPLLAPRQAVRVPVASYENWTFTGYRVLEGQELQFHASGTISLQKGNPIAFPCSPDGISLKTVQQPFREKNIGALIGKIVQLIAVEVDEETGEETRFEEEELFYIGAKNRVTMPLSGRLYLGVNELVADDNEGVFTVILFLR
ncbi:MAG: hypothetical protein PVF22_00540 [Candidatus Aminicenantes bacterium]